MSEQLKPCPFCGSPDIDPTGISMFDPKEMPNPDGTLRNWAEDALPERIIHAPACNNCGATTNGDWNTRPTPDVAGDALKQLQAQGA